jgi:hypothetical protein
MKTAELAASILQQHLPAAAVPVDAIQLSGELHQSSTARYPAPAPDAVCRRLPTHSGCVCAAVSRRQAADPLSTAVRHHC